MAFGSILTTTLIAYLFHIPKLALLWLFMFIGMVYLSGMYYLVTSYRIRINDTLHLQHGFKEDDASFEENFYEIPYSDIEIIGIRRNPLFFFQKCLVIKPHNVRFKRICIPLNLKGFDEFYEHLQNRINSSTST